MIYMEGKLCPQCNKTKQLKEFYLTNNKSDIYHCYCKTWMKKNQTKYRRTNGYNVSNTSQKNSNKVKLELFDILGGAKCILCEITDVEVLTFDHIDNDGIEDRKRGLNGSYMSRYYRIHPEEAKKKLQVLCFNCNRKKANYYMAFKRLERFNIP